MRWRGRKASAGSWRRHLPQRQGPRVSRGNKSWPISCAHLPSITPRWVLYPIAPGRCLSSRRRHFWHLQRGRVGRARASQGWSVFFLFFISFFPGLGYFCGKRFCIGTKRVSRVGNVVGRRSTRSSNVRFQDFPAR